MSLLKAYGAYIFGIATIVLAFTVMALRGENENLTRQLELSNGIIRQLQQSQELSEAASQKYAEHKEATRNETARQNQIVNEALDSNKTWADELLPDWVRGLLDTETSTPGAVPPTDGASR